MFCSILLYLRRSTLLFIHCSARYKVHLLSAECCESTCAGELWAACVRAGGGYCTCCLVSRRDERWGEMTGLQTMQPGQVRKTGYQRHQWQLHLTKQSAATEIIREELVQLFTWNFNFHVARMLAWLLNITTQHYFYVVVDWDWREERCEF